MLELWWHLPLNLFSFSLHINAFFFLPHLTSSLIISQVLTQHPITLFQRFINRLMHTHSLNQAEGLHICLDSCYKKSRLLNTAVLFHYIITAPQEAGSSLTPSSLFLSLFSTSSCHFYVNWKAQPEEKLETDHEKMWVGERATVNGESLARPYSWPVRYIVCLCLFTRGERHIERLHQRFREL